MAKLNMQLPRKGHSRGTQTSLDTRKGSDDKDWQHEIAFHLKQNEQTKRNSHLERSNPNCCGTLEHGSTKILKWATSWQNNKMACAASEDSDQPGLIWVYAGLTCHLVGFCHALAQISVKISRKCHTHESYHILPEAQTEDEMGNK